MNDPTYLRTIHDGLLSGIIHKDNASTLPIGLIGIYEDALPPASNVCIVIFLSIFKSTAILLSCLFIRELKDLVLEFKTLASFANSSFK